MKYLVSWQYCKNPNEINEAIRNEDPNWDGLTSATQIISIFWNPEHRLYQVFWRVEDNEEDRYWETSACTLDYTSNPKEEKPL